MGWLNANASGVQAIATIVLVVATIVYACLTGRALAQAKKSAAASAELARQAEVSQRAAVEPLVLPTRVRLLPAWAPGLFGRVGIGETAQIAVKNVGQGAAYSVEVAVGNVRENREWAAVMAPVTLAPGESFRGLVKLSGMSGPLRSRKSLDKALAREPSGGSGQFAIRVEYNNMFGRRQRVEVSYVLVKPPGQAGACVMVGKPVVKGHILLDEAGDGGTPTAGQRDGCDSGKPAGQ